MENDHSEESSEFLKAVLDSSPGIISVLTKDGIFKYVNRVVEGLKVSRVVGSCLFDYIAKDEVDELKQHVATALSENKTVWYETRGAGPNDTEAVYSCSLSPFTYKNERLLVSIGVDITNQKKIEHELQVKMKQLEMLNESMMNREVKMVELKKKLEELGHKV